MLIVILGNAAAIASIGSFGDGAQATEIDILLAQVNYYYSIFFLVEFLMQVCVLALLCHVWGLFALGDME